MTSPGTEQPIATPEQIVKSDLEIYMYNYIGTTNQAFETTDNELYKKIWERKQWITSFDQAYKDSIAGKGLFMDYRIGMKTAVFAGYLDSNGQSLMHLAGYNFFHFPKTWATSPRNMFIESLNDGMLQAIQTGHMDFWQAQTLAQLKLENLRKTPKHLRQKVVYVPLEQPLTIEDLQGPFYMFGFFIGLCLVSFAFESTCGNLLRWRRGPQIRSESMYPEQAWGRY